MCADFFFNFQKYFPKLDIYKCPFSENTLKKVEKNRHVLQHWNW